MTRPPVLILGGRSDIGLACAHAFAAEGHPVHLAARNVATLEPAAIDISIRHGVKVALHEFDVLSAEPASPFLEQMQPLPGIVICAVGLLGDESEARADPKIARTIMRTNYEGPAIILEQIASRMAGRGEGIIVGISSVAGDRGRPGNYIYGSAKAGFTAYLSGLRGRLARRGVHVLTVKPGPVATRMTESMNLPTILTAQPNEVANAIVHAVKKRQNVVYVKPIWLITMAIIRSIPEPLFKKIRL